MINTHRLRLYALSWSISWPPPKLWHMHDLIAADNHLETVEPATPLCHWNEQQAWIHILSNLRFSSGICPTFEALAMSKCAAEISTARHSSYGAFGWCCYQRRRRFVLLPSRILDWAILFIDAQNS